MYAESECKSEQIIDTNYSQKKRCWIKICSHIHQLRITKNIQTSLEYKSTQIILTHSILGKLPKKRKNQKSEDYVKKMNGEDNDKDPAQIMQ